MNYGTAMGNENISTSNYSITFKYSSSLSTSHEVPVELAETAMKSVADLSERLQKSTSLTAISSFSDSHFTQAKVKKYGKATEMFSQTTTAAGKKVYSNINARVSANHQKTDISNRKDLPTMISRSIEITHPKIKQDFLLDYQIPGTHLDVAKASFASLSPISKWEHSDASSHLHEENDLDMKYQLSAPSKPVDAELSPAKYISVLTSEKYHASKLSGTIGSTKYQLQNSKMDSSVLTSTSAHHSDETSKSAAPSSVAPNVASSIIVPSSQRNETAGDWHMKSAISDSSLVQVYKYAESATDHKTATEEHGTFSPADAIGSAVVPLLSELQDVSKRHLASTLSDAFVMSQASSTSLSDQTPRTGYEISNSAAISPTEVSSLRKCFVYNAHEWGQWSCV